MLLPSIILFKKSAKAVILMWIPNKYAKKKKNHIFNITFGFEKKTLKDATSLCIGPKRRNQLNDGLVTM